MGERGVTFHFLPCLSPLGDPLHVSPCVCGGDGGLEGQNAQERPGLLVAGSLKAARSQHAGAQARDGRGGGASELW